MDERRESENSVTKNRTGIERKSDRELVVKLLIPGRRAHYRKRSTNSTSL